MARRKKTRKQQRADAVSVRMKEIVGLLLLAAAFVVTLSLVSYDPDDETFLTADTADQPTRNYIGIVGANLSVILLQLTGYAAWVLPLAMFVTGGALLLRVPIKAPVTKSIGTLGIIIFLALLLGMFNPIQIIRGTAHAWSGGGVLADTSIDWLQPYLGELGLLILAAAGVGVSLLMTLHFSFGSFFMGVGRAIVSFFDGLKHRHKPKKPRAQAAKQSSSGGEPKVIVRVQLGWPFRRRTKDAEAEEISQEPSVKTMEMGSPEEDDEEVEITELPPHADETEGEEEVFQPKVAIPKRRRKVIAPEKLVGIHAPIDILNEPPERQEPLNLKMLAEQARAIVSRYKEFNIEGEVLQTNPGPVVNTFEFKPAPGVKYNKVVNLANELCMALQAVSVRISRIAGKSTIGLEVPNSNRETIYFRELVESPEYQNSKSPLTIGLGKTISGDPYVSKLDNMPHLLIGGATGTGKSVSLNTLICSILFKSPPETVKFIMIDPKHVELNLYDGIPHLLTPVVSQPKQATSALRWACEEMEVRYRQLAENGVRNIKQFNEMVAEKSRDQPNLPLDDEDEEEPLESMPYVVIVIDELADLMMASSNEVEESICRLAQKARAVGIHLIIATQRPSVDVLTGTIKANFPSRISFEVFSKVDSRVILDSYGAEDLLGKGDMLFMPPGTSRLMRLHGSFITEKEIKRLVDHLKRQAEPEYDEDILTDEDEGDGLVPAELAPDRDPLYKEAVNLVLTTNTASISNLQRKMRLGYARAARIIDMMEQDGIIGPADGSKPREILKKTMNG